jgi:hypothetical protein
MKILWRQSYCQYSDILCENRIQGTLQLTKPVPPISLEPDHLAPGVNPSVSAPSPYNSGGAT